MSTAHAIYRRFISHTAGQDPLDGYWRQAAGFVERHYPTDPEMLMAAGLLTPHAKQGLSFLWRAVRLGRQPLFHAAHVSRLIKSAPPPARPAPAPSPRPARAPSSQPTPAAPTPEAANALRPILNALHAWGAVDPDNGLPDALESHYLYDLRRDQDALRTWERAGRLPQARDYAWPMDVACARLLHRMGVVEADAMVLSFRWQSHWTFDVLGAGARAARAEGYAAQREGRAEDAIRWWNSTISLGRLLEESAETEDDFRRGALVEWIGATPRERSESRGKSKGRSPGTAASPLVPPLHLSAEGGRGARGRCRDETISWFAEH